MIFLVDLSQPDLFHKELFPVLGGTFYILVEGPASPARVAQIKNVFPDLSLGTVKVVFVKSFTKTTIGKFACDKCEHPDNVVDLRPTEWMLHTHLFPPSVSREVIRSTPFNPEHRDAILKMILDCMCAIIGGIRISSDEFPVLAHIQDKFGEFLEIGDEFVEDFNAYKHSVFCKPREHVWTRMDPSGTFRWPVQSKQLSQLKQIIDRISFEDLIHLADHEELVSATYTTTPPEKSINDNVLPVDIREFVCSRTQTNGSFLCFPSNEGPEIDWVKDVTIYFPESNLIDLIIETRTDPRVQVGILDEFFEKVSSGGLVYFKHPDMALTVMLSTWSTPVPLGSLYGNLSHVFENFAQFRACADGSIWVQKRFVD